MQAQDSIVGFLQEILQPLVDIIGIKMIDWIALAFMFEAIAFLLIIILIRVISGRGSMKVKLKVPSLEERGSEISGEKLAGLKALIISTSAAMQTLDSLKSKKEIGIETYTQLSTRYREQLAKIEEKLTAEMDSAERERLRQRYDESLRPTPTTPASATSSDSVTTDTLSEQPAAPSPPSGPPSGPPSAPSPPSGPPTSTQPDSVGEDGLPTRSTSIAALRNEMLKELKRLRDLLKTE